MQGRSLDQPSESCISTACISFDFLSFTALLPHAQELIYCCGLRAKGSSCSVHNLGRGVVQADRLRRDADIPAGHKQSDRNLACWLAAEAFVGTVACVIALALHIKAFYW